jgi:ElaB/YqjD/DUF883 family membrane-anchored ribosome-binding protein
MEHDNTNVAHDLRDLGRLTQKEGPEMSAEKPFAKHSAEFREKASVLGNDLKNLKKAGGALAKDALQSFTGNASEYYDQGIQKAKKLEKNLERDIQGNPIRYVLIATGIGLLAGILLRWRRPAKKQD